MPRSVTRALLLAGLLVAGVLTIIGGLTLGTPGIVAVSVAGLIAGLTAAAIAHDGPTRSPRSTAEAGVSALAATVGGLLVVSGTAALVGGAVTAGLLAGVLLWFLLRNDRRFDSRSAGSARHPSAGLTALQLHAVAAPADALPVAALSTAALGREWRRTAAALGGPLDAATRRSILERREATLDELERRDPDGFARWISAGPTADSDPADYVGGGPVTGTEAV